MVRIVDEDDGCRTEVIRPLVPLIDSIGFNLIFTHFGLRTYIRDKELTYEEIKEKGDGFLQRNSMYFFCESSQRETTLKDTHIGRLLNHKIADPKPTVEIMVPLEGAEERDGGALQIQVRKDIVYRDTITKEEIGWYNVRANILWMTDIVHFDNRLIRLLQPVLEGIREFRDTGKIKGVRKLTIGADPEFEIVDEDNRLIPAHDLWGMTGEIGCDGHTSTGELRPKPAETPLALVRNIRRLIRKLASHPKIPPNAKIQAGGGIHITTGGHIHFSVKKMTPAMKEALHYLIGDAVIPHQGGQRVNLTNTTDRGGSDAVREKEHGTEWRSLPSWLVSEDMCTAIIVVSYCIMKDCVNGNFRTQDDKAACLRKLSTYSIYSKYVEKFIEMFYTNTKKIKLEGVDVIPNWGFQKSEKVFNVQILSKWQDISTFFRPVAVKLNKVVRIRVEYAGDRIYIEGIPENLVPDWQEFADDHFVDLVVKKTVETQDKYTSEKRPKGYISAIIIIPQIWEKAKTKKRLFRKLRVLIQNAAIGLGGRP